MLSEKNRALIESFGRGLLPCLEASGAPVTIDEINALMNAARHQAQEEAKAVTVEGEMFQVCEHLIAVYDYADQNDPILAEIVSEAKSAIRPFMISNQIEQASRITGQDQCGSRDEPAVDATAALAMEDILADANFVHLNMLRGGIAKLSPAHIGHLYRGDEALAVIAEIERQNPDLRATASTTPDTGAEKVAAQVEDEGSREALNPLPNQHTRDRIAELPQDVIDLVIAAREAFPDMPDCDTKDAFDDALEAFAERVPYENEPALNTKDNT